MSASDSKAGWIIEGLQRFFGLFSLLSPVKIDEDMPELDMRLWRFSPDDYEIELEKQGHGQTEEVFCKVRIWLPVDGGEYQPLDHEQWLPPAENANRIPLPPDTIPVEILESHRPIPRARKIRGLPWVAILSRRKNSISRAGVFHGRVAYSDKAIPLHLCLRFFWDLVTAHFLAISLRFLFSVTIILFLVFLVVSLGFRGWVGGLLQEFWKGWQQFSS
jgi:hypothetical protein